MKVRLEVNLKTINGVILPKGSIFSDEEKPLPAIITRKIGTKMVTVIEDRKIVPTKIKEQSFTFEEPAPKPENTTPLPEKVMVETEEQVVDSTEVEEPVEVEESEEENPLLKELEVEESPKRTYRRRGRRKKNADDD